MADVFSTMKAYTGSVYVNDYNIFNRISRVYIQAEAPYRQQRDNIGLFFVRGSDGDMIPLTALELLIIQPDREVSDALTCLIQPLSEEPQPMEQVPVR